MTAEPIVLMSDRRLLAIPVIECGEPLFDLHKVPELALDARQADPAGAYARLRIGLVDRLLSAQELLPARHRLLIVEGYRPLSLQRHYFTRYAAELRDANPSWSEEHLHVQASRSLAPPEVAPHVCGAAVDLTLIDATGAELDMGTPVNAGPEESGGACYTHHPAISSQTRANRRLLAQAMSAAGFINYPTEWWHWSYGDRYWALTTGAPAALYGPLDWNGPAEDGTSGHPS
ncbi:M15 family metallopeptidase [Nonomuraea sp. PA05]|uniref:M15 family metallopeptidase n=1 Tax=Nonomuraea sp. PA05 TaxID=2604466 RepID=UPI0011DC51E2|nr:M15 family metallopeptidase [Nonomuraea sp. PA05]TYB64829.1 M15 family metallopeptidase [Nonomuraea sp. PA05]